jgi:nucleoside-diphosphate-sugar epimerase
VDIASPRGHADSFGGDALIHLAPLPLLPPLLPAFAADGGRRVIAFGSTGRFSKAHSHHPKENAFAVRMERAEHDLAEFCTAAGIRWTLFRPTLIYGCGIDRNVALIARLIRRFRCFPLLGTARGLRQPVHCADLAAACVAALDNPASFDKAYDLSGGDTLPYREMVERIFEGLGMRPLFLPVPIAFFRLAMWSISRIPRYRDFNAEMAQRMNDDMAFDHSAAMRDFGYAPRPFRPDAQALLAQ